MLKTLLDGLPSLARELGKPIPEVHVHASCPLVFLPPCHATLLTVFTHLLRNSMDHGLETAEERLAVGKPEAGTMQIEVFADVKSVQIVFEDDGRGLNLSKIRARAVKAGLLDPTASPGAEDVAEMIFSSGFSTADSISQTSGRGVGLDAARAAVEEQGGEMSIQIRDTPAAEGFALFAFCIRLPAECVRFQAPSLAS